MNSLTITLLLSAFSFHQPSPLPIRTAPPTPPLVLVVQPIKPVEPPKPPEPVKPPPPSVVGPGNPNNTYDWGNCTWYVANHRSIPESWGNAATWAPRAEDDGYVVSDMPKVGAVAWREPGYSLGHVAIVEAVNDDGSIEISEMNVLGLDRTDTRTVTTAGWRFIY